MSALREEILDLLSAEAKRFDSSVARRPHLLAVLAIRFFNDFAMADAAREVSKSIAGVKPYNGTLEIGPRVKPFLDACTDEESIRSVYRALILSMAPQPDSDGGSQSQDESQAQQDADAADKSESLPEEKLEDVLAELNALIGLDAVKEQVKRAAAIHQVNAKRVDAGMNPVEVSHHMVFLGDPGTGKTTVARIVARVYKSIGLLERGHMVEAQRTDLVAGYIGQTALKTEAVIKDAIGGVLFIDEAYTLGSSSSDSKDFGLEAIATLLKAMEDRRGEFAVIVAGYTSEMHKFLDSNPGLRSRFSNTIEFANYSAEELMRVFEKLCNDNQMSADAGVREKLSQHLHSKDTGGKTGNARYIRSIFEAMFANLSVRLMADENASVSGLKAFTVADLPDFSDDEAMRKHNQRFGFVP